MFGLIKKTFLSAMTFFSCNVFNVNSLKYVLMNNQECKINQKQSILTLMNQISTPIVLK